MSRSSKEGNAAGVLGKETTITATYQSPFAVQAPLEAPAALADVQDGQVNVWVSTQAQERAKGLIAEALGVDAESVRVVPTYLGGGFGSKLDTGVATEAARLSKAVGAPVHVGWDRAEALRNGYLRPPTKNILSGAAGQCRADRRHRTPAGEQRSSFQFHAEISGICHGGGFRRDDRVAYRI